MLVIIGNILGYLAIASGLLVYISVKRKRILAIKTVTECLFASHQFCLSMFAGGCLSAIAIARSAVFYHRGRHKWADSPLWLVLFILLTIISPILTWAGPITLLPAIGSILCVFGYFCKNTMLLRIFSFLGEGMWLVYGLLGGSIQLAISGTIAIISLSIGTIREIGQKRKIKRNPALKTL